MNSTKQNPLVSVIIPVYKVEAYLQRCIDSIIAQSYTNIEIILVDDGSPDLCPKICDSYAEKDNRIKVIHQNNGGLSDARNTGMNQCTGDYITFVDSDDWVDNSYIMNLIQPTNEDHYDMVIADFSETESIPLCHISCKTGAVVNNSNVISLFCNQKYPQCAWAKLYSANFIKENQLSFEKGIFFEDQLWSCLLASKATKIYITNTKNYHYLIRKDSIMNSLRVDFDKWLFSWQKILIQEKKILESYKESLENSKNIFFVLKLSEVYSTFAVQRFFFKQAFKMTENILERNPIFFWSKTSKLYKKIIFKFLNKLPSFISREILYIYFKQKKCHP